MSVQFLVSPLLDLGFPASGLLGITLPFLGGAELLEAATGHPGFRLLVGDAGQVSHTGSLGAEASHYESITGPKLEDLVPQLLPAICSTPWCGDPVFGRRYPGRPTWLAGLDFTFS